MRNVRAGQFASNNPRVMLLAGPLALQSWGEDGVEVGVFAWVNPNTGRVENTRYNADQPLGLVMPMANYEPISRFQGIIPPGYEVTLASRGDFFVVFPNGATLGQQVYASIFDGTPISGETADTQVTPWFVATDAAPGGLAIISTWR